MWRPRGLVGWWPPSAPARAEVRPALRRARQAPAPCPPQDAGSPHLLDDEVAVEERLVLREERRRDVAPLGERRGQARGTPARREHVPVGEPRAATPRPGEALEQRAVGFG